MPKLTTILFDLDGTLLEMKTEPFINQYLQHLGQYLEKHRFDAKLILGCILEATKAMIASRETDKTNEQVFIAQFCQQSGLTQEKIWPIFDTFYQEVFPTLSHLAFPSPWGKKIVEAARQAGFRVALATNPVFPKTAICSRLAWIELTPYDFDWVKGYEETHFTKPHAGFYLEICDSLDVRPDECIMVGNHMQEDMVASTLGMKTFLVTNHLEDRGEPTYPVNQQGTLEELYQAIVNRTGIFSLES